jgi:hypothetical protein
MECDVEKRKRMRSSFKTAHKQVQHQGFEDRKRARMTTANWYEALSY